MSPRELPKPSPRELAQVYFDNVASTQIGGQTDGISEEVAADLGYHTRDQAEAIIKGTDPTIRRLARLGIGQVQTPELSSAEKNANERRAIAAHLKRVTKQVQDDGYYR